MKRQYLLIGFNLLVQCLVAFLIFPTVTHGICVVVTANVGARKSEFHTKIALIYHGKKPDTHLDIHAMPVEYLKFKSVF